MARADKRTVTEVQPVFYRDFMTSFTRNPVTSVLAVVTNEEAVKQGLKNLILTNLSERFYNPNIGSKVLASLFELQDQVSEDLLKKLVEECVHQVYRANLINVDLTPNRDGNSYELTVLFSLINVPQQPISLSITLNRVR